MVAVKNVLESVCFLVFLNKMFMNVATDVSHYFVSFIGWRGWRISRVIVS